MCREQDWKEDAALNKKTESTTISGTLFQNKFTTLGFFSANGRVSFMFSQELVKDEIGRLLLSEQSAGFVFSTETLLFARAPCLILTAARRLFLQTHTRLVRQRRRSSDVTESRGRHRISAIKLSRPVSEGSSLNKTADQAVKYPTCKHGEDLLKARVGAEARQGERWREDRYPSGSREFGHFCCSWFRSGVCSFTSSQFLAFLQSSVLYIAIRCMSLGGCCILGMQRAINPWLQKRVFALYSIFVRENNT